MAIFTTKWITKDKGILGRMFKDVDIDLFFWKMNFEFTKLIHNKQ